MICPYLFLEELSNHIKNGIVITDAGQTLVWTMQAFKIHGSTRLFSSFNHSPMGYALPASIGAQIASPRALVACIIGDGGMQMNIQELETIVFNKLPIKIFMINNGGYGMIKQTQDDWMGSHYAGVDENSNLGIPDTMKIAAAYGMICAKIQEKEGLSVIEWVLGLKSPVFCEVMVSPQEKIRHKLLFGKSLEEIT